MLHKLDIAELHHAAERARLDALDVVDVAEDARERLGIIAAGVPDRVADQIDLTSLDLRGGLGG